MQQYLPTELARNIGALLWQLLWYLTTNCVLGYTLLWHFILNSVRDNTIFKRKDYELSKFMLMIHYIFNNISYLCARNAQCLARTTKNNMEIQRYNRLKIVLAEKERTGTWLSEQMGHNICTVSRWMTNKVQPSVEQLYEIAHHLDVDVKELLVSSKNQR